MREQMPVQPRLLGPLLRSTVVPSPPHGVPLLLSRVFGGPDAAGLQLQYRTRQLASMAIGATWVLATARHAHAQYCGLVVRIARRRRCK